MSSPRSPNGYDLWVMIRRPVGPHHRGMNAPSVFDADLPVLDSMSPEYQSDWHGQNREALARGPIAMTPIGPAMLGYRAVQFALRDRRFRMPTGLALELQGIDSGPLWDRTVTSLLSLDGDEHQRLRRLVAKAFTPRAADALRRAMVPVIDGLVDEVSDRGEADVVTDLARAYPVKVICHLLGAPIDDWPLFSAWGDDIIKVLGFNVAEDGPAILRAFAELDAYIDAMVEDRRRSLTDDLVSDLIRAEDDGDRLTHDELRMLVGTVLIGGSDTTSGQLAAAVEVFCDHPDQWARLAEHPELAAGAVDEVLRHSPVVIGTMRRTTEEVELCGWTIPAGSLVDIYTAAANRDPELFGDPDRFDIERSGPPILTFGGGIHHCLGIHLAKAELAEALKVMARRMPNLRRAGPSPWKPISSISGPMTMPVTFAPGH
jgi:cytochrome P450